jgi:hypothetical protein
MKTITFLFGACALLALPIEMAAAGPCTTEIDSLTKLMASRDAGAGPTAGVAGTTSGLRPWVPRIQARRPPQPQHNRLGRSIRRPR